MQLTVTVNMHSYVTLIKQLMYRITSIVIFLLFHIQRHHQTKLECKTRFTLMARNYMGKYYRELQKGNIENFTIFFYFLFFEDFFILRLSQKEISFLAGVVFEIFALELF